MPADARRVLVSGISGAGKSTLARRIATARGLPYVELDALHHGPGWVRRPAFEADVAALVAGEAWVTEDQYASLLGDALWARADAVVWLDLPRLRVQTRVVPRTVRRLVTREELWNGNRERWSSLLEPDHPVRWAWTEYHRRRRETWARLARHPEVRLVHLRSARAANAWVRTALSPGPGPRRGR